MPKTAAHHYSTRPSLSWKETCRIHHSYPLDWPSRVPRTASSERRPSPFRLCPTEALQELKRELHLWSVAEASMTTDSVPSGDGIHIRLVNDDPGVTLRWHKDEEEWELAADHFNSLWANVTAIAREIASMRRAERHGAHPCTRHRGSRLSARPINVDPDTWWAVLGLSRTASAASIQCAYRRLALIRHPDRGGTHEAMSMLNWAYRSALDEVGR
jgi:alkylhydroperoxidase family enzyme